MAHGDEVPSARQVRERERVRWQPAPEWRNGRRSRLKPGGRKAWGFESLLRHQARPSAIVRDALHGVLARRVLARLRHSRIAVVGRIGRGGLVEGVVVLGCLSGAPIQLVVDHCGIEGGMTRAEPLSRGGRAPAAGPSFPTGRSPPRCR